MTDRPLGAMERAIITQLDAAGDDGLTLTQIMKRFALCRPDLRQIRSRSMWHDSITRLWAHNLVRRVGKAGNAFVYARQRPPTVAEMSAQIDRRLKERRRVRAETPVTC